MQLLYINPQIKAEHKEPHQTNKLHTQAYRNRKPPTNKYAIYSIKYENRYLLKRTRTMSLKPSVDESLGLEYISGMAPLVTYSEDIHSLVMVDGLSELIWWFDLSIAYHKIIFCYHFEERTYDLFVGNAFDILYLICFKSPVYNPQMPTNHLWYATLPWWVCVPLMKVNTTKLSKFSSQSTISLSSICPSSQLIHC